MGRLSKIRLNGVDIDVTSASIIVSSTQPTTGEDVWIDFQNKSIYVKNGTTYSLLYSEAGIQETIPTIYTGTSTPSDSLGKNGDIYIVTE